MKLYNSLSQRVETFTVQDGVVKVYTCGITPYDTTHLGHAFTYTMTDILLRYLEFIGNKVQYVQNVTDIDDDILRKAKETNEDWSALGNRWTAHFIKDMQALNVRPPDYYPRATDVIPEIVSMIGDLLARGYAYENSGSVYFDIDSWSEFGKLSRLSRAEMLPIANERGNHPEDPNKRQPLDFVLWQSQTPEEPGWSSPWGPGRPGWHIECSTMSTELLGETIDIHIGGADLQFPHHESEIAQIEPLTGKTFVRYWMHIAMVEYAGEKMSKSLGNLVMASDLLETWSSDALRLYLAAHHYRRAWEYDERGLAQAEKLAAKLHSATTVEGADKALADVSEHEEAFDEAMRNDLDTPAALKVLSDCSDQIIAAAKAGMRVKPAQEILRCASYVFGMRLDGRDPDARVRNGWNQHLRSFESL